MTDKPGDKQLGRREEKREATKQEILTAASELFKTKGYESTSVDDIVMAANLAKGTFYYHFQKKEDVLFALQEAQLRETAAHAQTSLASGTSPRKVLLDFLIEAAHWTEENPELARAFHKQKFAQLAGSSEHGKSECPPPAGPPPAVKMYFFSVILEIIGKAQNAGELRNDVSAEELAHLIIPVVMFTRMSWLSDTTSGSLIGRLEKSLQILLDGLSPH